MTGKSSLEQLEKIKSVLSELKGIYDKSPLGQQEQTSYADIVGKMKAWNSDHSSDQKLLAKYVFCSKFG